MKTTINKYRKHLGALLLILIFSGCSPSKDIYNNPYPPKPASVSTLTVPSTDQQLVKKDPECEWCFAVSKEFIVGYGEGKDIMEAKEAALNSIKAFIIKSLGEKGNVVEVNFVQNLVTGRGAADGQQAYLLKYQFENEFHPVINISMARLDDYYYEASSNLAKYFIKYVISEEELNRIKADFQKSLAQKELFVHRMKRTVDSILALTESHSVEDLIKTYDLIVESLKQNRLSPSDSSRMMTGLRGIASTLNALEIRVTRHDPGQTVQFGLFSGSSLMQVNDRPMVRSEAVRMDTLTKKNDLWTLSYTVNPDLSRSGSVEVYYDLPFRRISTRVEITPLITTPEFEVVGELLLSDFETSIWTNNVKRFKMRVHLNSLGKDKVKISGMDILLHLPDYAGPVIIPKTLSADVSKGLNQLTAIVECDLPERFFLRNESDCDLRIIYDSDNTRKMALLKGVELNINKF